jgi:solute:Na+ symporter, SSS family
MYTFGMSPATQGYQAAALNPHEAQMSRVWSILRNIITVTLPFFMPIVAYTILHHAKYSDIAAEIMPLITAAGNPAEQSQIRTASVLSYILPAGLKGLFLVSALATAITTDSTFMQSLGTVFTQDIVLPLRGRRFNPKTHMLILRCSMLGVGLIVFFFSSVFPQNDFLWMYMIQALGIYLSGIGVVTIGGLYWSKGSTAGAWAGMLTGMTVSIALFITRILNSDFFLNGMECSCVAAVFATVSYVAVSLLKPANVDLKALMHNSINHKQSGIRLVIKHLCSLPDGFTSSLDKFLGYLVRVLTVAMLGTFTVLTVFNLAIRKLSDDWWFGFWKIYLSFVVITATIFTIWLFIGGMLDMKRLIGLLKSKIRDDNDDGTVE